MIDLTKFSSNFVFGFIVKLFPFFIYISKIEFQA